MRIAVICLHIVPKMSVYGLLKVLQQKDSRQDCPFGSFRIVFVRTSLKSNSESRNVRTLSGKVKG